MYSFKKRAYIALAIGAITLTTGCASVKPYLDISLEQTSNGEVEPIAQAGLKLGPSKTLTEILLSPKEWTTKKDNDYSREYKN